jgi:C4-type Zn-finger protein
MDKIKAVKCPNCRSWLRLYVKSNDINRDNALETRIGERFWQCNECTFRYPEKFFNEFKQFEHLVVRKS